MSKTLYFNLSVDWEIGFLFASSDWQICQRTWWFEKETDASEENNSQWPEGLV